MTEQWQVSQMIGVVRGLLYVNGTPPEGWSVAREVSVLKLLLRRRSPHEVRNAIEGLALLRDHPEGCPDVVRAFRKGEALTLRPLIAKSDLTPMFALATRAYWAHQNKRQRAPRETWDQLGAILNRAQEVAARKPSSGSGARSPHPQEG